MEILLKTVDAGTRPRCGGSVRVVATLLLCASALGALAPAARRHAPEEAFLTADLELAGVLGWGAAVAIVVLVAAGWAWQATLKRAVAQRTADLEREAREATREAAELRGRVERFDLALRGTNDGLWDMKVLPDEPLNPQNAIYYAPRFRELLGYEPEQFKDVLASWLSRLHPEDHDRLTKAIKSHLVDDAPLKIDCRVRTSKGEYRWFVVSGQAIRDEAGAPTRIAGSIRDITARRRAEEELRRLAAVVRDSNDAITVQGFDGRILAWNHGAERIYGWSEHEAVGMNISKLIPEDKREEAAAFVEKLATADSVKSFETQRATRHGKRVDVMLTGTKLVDEKNRPVAIATTERDVTEHRQRDAEIQRLSQFRETVIETADVWLDVLDEKGDVVIWNKAAEAISGYSREDVAGAGKIWELLYPDEAYRKEVVARFSETVEAGGALEDSETTIRGKDGETRVISWNSRGLRDDKDRLLGSVSIGRDITEKKSAEAALRRSDETARALLNAPLDAAMLVAPDGVVLAANEAAGRSFGKRADELVDANYYDLLPAEGVESRKAHMAGVIESGKPASFDDELSGRFVANRIYPLFDADGKVERLAVFCHDVTQRKRMEEQLRHTAKMQAVGQLAGGLAHDFNDLLTGILGEANMLRLSAEEDTAVHEAAGTIEQAAAAAAELTCQLRGFASKGKDQVVAVDLHATIPQVVATLGRTIHQNVRIVQQFDAKTATVMGDPGQLQQCILTLAINARDAMPEGGELTFHTRLLDLGAEYCRTHPGLEPGQHLMVAVTDTGCGIPKDIQDRIFEPFFTTKEHGKGTGMGLATVYGGVRNHGGAIELESEEGKGATFRLYLPLAKAPKESPTKVEAPEPVEGVGHILVVDDQEIVANVVSHMLRRLGYQVAAAGNGREAVEYYRKHGERVDLVLLDLIMPEMDGRQCFRALRELNPDVRVLLSTAASVEDEAEGIVEEGVLGVLKKPYRVSELGEKVAAILKPSRGPAGDTG